jgi:hypothetical protein
MPGMRGHQCAACEPVPLQEADMMDQARAEYEALPESIRAYYTYEQYLWLSETQKALLIQTETEPDQYDC